MNIVTSSQSCIFYRGALQVLQRGGLDTALCSSPGEELQCVATEEQSSSFEVAMEREIRPVRDVIAVWNLYGLIRRCRPQIVTASTPKAGLLGMLAAWLARVPIRIYMLRGLRLETACGMKRHLLRISERLASACAHRVVCVSESLRRTYVAERLAPGGKTSVLGAGSSNGVDSRRFHVTPELLQEARALRALLGIPISAPVLGFVGRLTRDKGIEQLAEAYRMVLAERADAWLLLVGDFEDGDPISGEAAKWLLNHRQVAISAFVADPRPYYAVMDILAFSSQREGLPNVPLEAAAMELPVVGFRATGMVDAVDDGGTGTLAPLGDVGAFADALLRYVNDATLRRAHGEAGRKRVLKLFRQEAVWQAWYDFYVGLLRERAMIVPELLAASETAALSTEAVEAQ